MRVIQKLLLLIVSIILGTYLIKTYLKEGYVINHLIKDEKKSEFITESVLVLVMSDQSKYRSKTLVKTFTEAGIEVQSLKGVTLEKPDNEFFELTPKEIKIHQLLFNLLGLCKKKFCVIVEDDFKPLIVGNNLVNKLFSELITFNSNDQYLFDCTKWGFFQKEYPISGNSLACRIAHYQLLRKVKKCYKDKKQINVPADVFYRDCLDKELLERRFLLGNTVDGSNY